MANNPNSVARTAQATLAVVLVSTLVPSNAKAARVIAVDDFKARVIDGDWALAVRAALAAANTGDTVSFTHNRLYTFKSVVLVDKPSITFEGKNALIAQSALDPVTGDLIIFRVEANDVRFSYLRLQATAAPKPLGPVQFLIEASSNGKRMRIDHCYLGAMPFSTSAAQAGIGFRVGADGGSVTFSQFETGVGGVFTQGHATLIADNVFRRPGDMSIAFNGPGASGGIALRNEIHAEGLAISASIGIEEGASDFRISYNRILGGHGPGIWCVKVALQERTTGGQIDHNWIDGRSQTGGSPTALMVITTNCSNIVIFDNYFYNSPLGHPENATIILSTSEISFIRNRVFPGPKASGYGLLVYVTNGRITLRDNLYRSRSVMPAVYFIKGNRIANVTQFNNRWFTPHAPVFP